MPNVGVPLSITCLMTGTAYAPVAAGSPGPFDRNTPSGFIARISSADVVAGTTGTLAAVSAATGPELRFLALAVAATRKEPLWLRAVTLFPLPLGAFPLASPLA